MLRSILIAAAATALVSASAAAQDRMSDPQPDLQRGAPSNVGPVGQGHHYGPGVPPFPSQNDGRLLLREGVFTMANGASQRVQVLSNSPVPNPGNVPGADAAGRATMNTGMAPVGWGNAYPAGSQPLASQTDGVLLVREVMLVDPRTGAAATTQILSNTPVPNPGTVRARLPRG